ncbi:hypothetical protein BC829DRAFT_446978 [Chytridium lagenaria]|nr:hypothetical protein BC829DRAFT_449354 [Chytridium lagenaria]KAI8840247.1 hypothetical protein BC829DRAFT_446978 [Chytridium lagenaria]
MTSTTSFVILLLAMAMSFASAVPVPAAVAEPAKINPVQCPQDPRLPCVIDY